MEITINEGQRLFVIPAGKGFSCMGFDNVFRQLGEALRRLGRSDDRASAEKIGTVEQYDAYREAIHEGVRHDAFKDTWFDVRTPDEVRRVLEKVRLNKTKVRLFLGDPETGRDWAGEYDLMGTVGRSSGITKVPLLVADGDDGGGAILDACILKIQRVSDGKVLYQHELYQLPELEIFEKNFSSGGKTYTHGVRREGAEVACFTSYGKAAQYIAFMHGECFRQPQ